MGDKKSLALSLTLVKGFERNNFDFLSGPFRRQVNICTIAGFSSRLLEHLVSFYWDKIFFGLHLYNTLYGKLFKLRYNTLYCKKVKAMNVMETSERNGGPVPRLEAKGTGTTNSVPQSGQKIIVIGSPFVRTGSIQMVHRALRIDYEAFNESHCAFIGPQDLQQLVRDRFAPAAPVKEIHRESSGTETSYKIGYGCRTASGKALKISTTTSGGDLVVPWSSFLKVVDGRIRSTPISRIAVPEVPPRQPAPAPARDIRHGLETRF